MIRFLIYTLILFLVVRALSRFWSGLVVGLNGGSGDAPHGARVPQRGVQMVRDPICGTFIVPERSITLQRVGQTLHFCSTTCRDQYLAGASSQTRGRTA